MNLSQFIENTFKRFIPAPFTLAVLLTLTTLFVAFFFTGEINSTSAIQILDFWQTGKWDPAHIVFMVQMMLILVLGHVLVLSKPISWLTSQLTKVVTGNASAVIIVSVSTMLVVYH